MTYRHFNPDGHRVDHNYDHYKSLKLDSSAYIPSDSMPYRDLYVEAVDLYLDEKYSEAIKKFEASLEDFYSKLDECYITCEAFNVNDVDASEYHGLISGFFIGLLKCRTECVKRLDYFRIEPEDDLLASHFKYMQFAYHKCEEVSHCCNRHL